MLSWLLVQTQYIKVLGIWEKTNQKNKPTQWIDLQICEEQVLIQVEEPNDKAGQDPAERRRHSTHVAAAPELTVDVSLIILQYRSHNHITAETISLVTQNKQFEDTSGILDYW